MKARILIVLPFLLLSRSLLAVSALDFTIHQEYTSTRALGFGNAFTAVADDHSAIFYNPAALDRREDGQFRMFIRAGISADVLDFQQGLSDVSDTDDVNKITEFIQKHYGDTLYSRVPTIGAMLVRPGWGLAIIPADFSTEIGIHRQTGPSLNVNAYLDSTIALSMATHFDSLKITDKDKFSVGTTVKVIHRAQVGESISAGMLMGDSEVFREENIQEGFTADLDLALMWELGLDRSGLLSRLVPRIVGMNIRNVLDYGFKFKGNFINEDSQDPSKLQRRIDLGVKYDLPNWWVFDPHFSLDVRDIGHENWSILKGLHAGAELYWTVFSWWKGSWSVGINQGYWTAGFGARFAWFQLDLASWGEEVGTSSDPKENRRYIVEMSLDF